MIQNKQRKKIARPITRKVKLDATPEEMAQAIFNAAKKPDASVQEKAKS